MRTILAILLITLMVAGCNRQTPKTTINIIGEDASNLKALNKAKTDFESISGVNIQFHPYSFEDAQQKSTKDLSAKSGFFDIVMQYNFSLSSFVRNDYVWLVNDLTNNLSADKISFENNLFQNAWKEIGYYRNPKDTSELLKVGYPFAFNTMMLVYNKGLFDRTDLRDKYRRLYGKEIEPPRTWEEYQRLAKFFTIKDENYYGVCLQGAQGAWLYYEYCNFLFGMGGKLMEKQYGWDSNDSTHILLESKEALAATELYVSLKPFNKGDFFSVGAYEQVQLVKEGNVAMAIIWSDLAYEIAYQKDGKIDERFGFAPIPGRVSGLAGGCFFISKASKHTSESIEYVASVLQPEAQKKLFKLGLCSPLRTTYDDPDVRCIPYAEALKLSLDRGVYMFEAGPDADMISQVVSTWLQQVWSEKVVAKEALHNMATEIVGKRPAYYK